MFAEQVLRGLGTAGWLIGLLAGLGMFLIVVGILGLLVIHAAGIIWPAEDTEKEKEATNREYDTDH